MNKLVECGDRIIPTPNGYVIITQDGKRVGEIVLDHNGFVIIVSQHRGHPED